MKYSVEMSTQKLGAQKVGGWVAGVFVNTIKEPVLILDSEQLLILDLKPAARSGILWPACLLKLAHGELYTSFTSTWIGQADVAFVSEHGLYDPDFVCLYRKPPRLLWQLF